LVGRRSAEEVKGILVHWAAVYGALLLSQAPRVRICANSAFAAMIQKVRNEPKPLAGQLPKLIGPWWLSCVDNSSECAMIGERSLTSIFPGQKLGDVLGACSLGIIRYLFSLILMTPLDLSKKAQGHAGTGKTQADDGNEMEERQTRVASTAVLALARLVSDLSDEVNEKLMVDTTPSEDEVPADGNSSDDVDNAAKDLSSSVSTPRQEQPPAFVLPSKVVSYVEVFVNTNVWKLMAHGHSHVRHSMYRLVVALSNCKPIRDTLSLHIKRRISMAVFTSLSEKEPANHASMFAAMISFTRAFPESWTFVDPFNFIFPKLFALLRHGFYGSGVASYPSLLPFLDSIPNDVFKNHPQGSQMFITDFFSQLWRGTVSPYLENVPALASAFMECLSYLATKRASVLLSISLQSALENIIRTAGEKGSILSLFVSLSHLRETNVADSSTRCLLSFSCSSCLWGISLFYPLF
jgi:hypothetical protein